MSRWSAVSGDDYQESYGDPMPRQRHSQKPTRITLKCHDCAWTGSVEDGIAHSRLQGHALAYRGVLQQFTEQR